MHSLPAEARDKSTIEKRKKRWSLIPSPRTSPHFAEIDLFLTPCGRQCSQQRWPLECHSPKRHLGLVRGWREMQGGAFLTDCDDGPSSWELLVMARHHFECCSLIYLFFFNTCKFRLPQELFPRQKIRISGCCCLESPPVGNLYIASSPLHSPLTRFIPLRFSMYLKARLS